jgi:hypothetical protein
VPQKEHKHGCDCRQGYTEPGNQDTKVGLNKGRIRYHRDNGHYEKATGFYTAKVVLEALREELTLQEIAKKYDVHPNETVH